MDYVRDGKIQGQCTFKKTKERPCISPSLTWSIDGFNFFIEYKSTDVSKKIYYSASFLALKMAAIVHVG